MAESVLILSLAVMLDVFAKEPPDLVHPVCWMGRMAGFIWKKRPSRGLFGYGVLLVLSGILVFGSGGWLVSFLPWPLRVPISVFLLKGTMAAGALADAGKSVGRALASRRLPLARRMLACHLVSRSTKCLSASEVAGAAAESLAENLSDGWVGPLTAFVFFGLPGAMIYRYVNTCDSMVGYRFGDFEPGGKAAARTDDLFNLIPAVISALLIVAAAFLTGLDWKGSALCSLREGRSTESPNAGWPMAAMAGALGVILSKRGSYELKGGDRHPFLSDLKAGIRIVEVSSGLAVFLALAVLTGRAFL